MKTLTNKQRAKLYRRVFESFYVTGTYRYDFCCIILAELVKKTHGIYTNAYEVMDCLPELELFEQPKNPMGGGWWPLNDKECRAYAMLLCEQIALNP